MFSRGMKSIGLGLMVCGVSAVTLSACVPQQPLQTSHRAVEAESIKITAKAKNNVNVRSDAGTDNKVFYSLQKGQRVELLEEKDSWYKIKNLTEPGQVVGWVRYDFLVIENNGAFVWNGRTTTDVKMRSGPGTNNSVVKVAKGGDRVVISGVEDDWYRVALGSDRGWIRNDFVVFHVGQQQTQYAAATPSSNTKETSSGSSSDSYASRLQSDNSSTSNYSGRTGQDNIATQAMLGPILPFERRVSYAGYSQGFQPIKSVMMEGDLNKTYDFIEQRDSDARKSSKNEDEFAENVGLLPLMERGSLLVDKGDMNKARVYLTHAESMLKLRDDRSHTEDAGQTVLASLGSFAGFGEAGEYDPEGFERVLLLNYKALAYLLDGKRKAFNVSLRAIDLQNKEREEFAKRLSDVKKEVEKEKENAQATEVGKMYEGYNEAGVAKAKTVKSAFVNPFGDYMAGLIWEFDGHRDSDLLSNAAISYQKAAELNPKVKFLKEAISDMKNRKLYKENKKVVHVVVGDGLAPERKTMTFGIPYNNGTIPVKIPVYEAEENKVGDIKVRIKGRKTRNLEKLADVEAIALRHDLDSRPFQTANVVVNVIRSVVEKEAMSRFGIFGQIISNVRESVSNPDMRSWATLPASFKANRFVVPAELKNLTIVTYDHKGKELATQTVALAKEGPTLVYGRSLNGALELHNNNDSWVVN